MHQGNHSFVIPQMLEAGMNNPEVKLIEGHLEALESFLLQVMFQAVKLA